MEKEKRLKLFGVVINEEESDIMRKSKSLGNLQSCDSNNQAVDDGYLSDGGLLQNSRTRIRQERKRGVPWSEEEHRTFLAGLEKLGKGDWRGISRNFVTTRTPTQVASHAQKYFLRQSNPNKKKRRSSLFDVGINDNATPASSELPTEFALKKVDIAAEMTNLHSKDTHMILAPSFIPTQATTQASEASQALSLSTNYSTTQYIHNVGFLGVASNSMSATHAIYPDFLQLSLPNFSSQQPVKSPSVNSNDLELSIAPPQPHPLPKLTPQHAAGAIWVT